MRRLLGFALGLFAAATTAQQQPGDAQRRARVEQALTANGFQGVFAVSVGGRRIAGGAIGEAAPGTPFTYEQVFPLASATKQVVATMVMQEVARGRLSLDAPAARYLPALGTAGRSPTVRELLQHRSGLRNPDDSPAGAQGWPSWYTGEPTGLAYCLSGRGAPGGNWRYNNCDYLVLGAIVERVERRPLPELYTERVAGPLGIGALFTVGPNDARADSLWSGGPTAQERGILARFGAAGALVGTADDLLAFDQGLMDGSLLPRAQLAELWRGDPKLGYQALGQWVFTAPLKGCAGPVRIVERRGAIGRFQVRNLIAPDQGTAAVMLTNRAEDRYDFGEIWQGKGTSYEVLSAALCP